MRVLLVVGPSNVVVVVMLLEAPLLSTPPLGLALATKPNASLHCVDCPASQCVCYGCFLGEQFEEATAPVSILGFQLSIGVFFMD